MPGLTVQLLDANGDVLATTTTNGRGNYTFTQLSGQAANPNIGSGVSATGTYDVVLVLPSWLKQYGTDPASIDITRGGTAVRNIDFGVTLAGFGGFGGDVDPRGWNNSLDAGIDSSNWRDLPVGLDHLQTTLMDA